MPTWDVIQSIVDGAREMVRDNLWDEIRSAFAERLSAMNAVCSTSVALPADVAPRDPIGLIEAYRLKLEDLLNPGGGATHYWAEEVAASEAAWPGGCPVWSVLGALEAAGLPDGWWTHANYFDTEPIPGLPYSEQWTDFYAVLNLEMILRAPAFVVGGWTWADVETGAADNADWATARAAAWASIPDGESPSGYPVYAAAGRPGIGSLSGGIYSARVSYRAWSQCTLDLSSIWDAEHAGGAPCDPTEVLFYLAVGPYNEYAEAYGTATFDVLLSGDGGSTWETLGQLTVDPNELPKYFKFSSTAPARWTASSVLRLAATCTKTADTPTWAAPTSPVPGEDEYDETVYEWELDVYVKFAFEFVAP